MKKPIILFLFCLFSQFSFGQDNAVNIVFDVTSPDPNTHQAVTRHLKMMSESYPEAQFEVVLYSKSVDMVLKDKSSVAEDLHKLAAKDNVSVNICAMTLKRREISKDQLISNVGTVPDGIMEIVQKQNEGWAYIKEAHH